MPSKNNPNKPKRRSAGGARKTKKQQSQSQKLAALSTFAETSKIELGTALSLNSGKHATLPRVGGVIHGSGGINKKRQRKEERRRKGMETKVKEIEKRDSEILAMLEGERMGLLNLLYGRGFANDV